MAREPLETRSELPWLLGAVVVVLAGWYAYNRLVLDIYPKDVSENGAFHVVTYGSDPNPARADQINKFNQYYRKDLLKVTLVPGGSNPNNITTTSAAKTAPDIIDAYAPEDIRTYIGKGIARPINQYLKANHIDIEAVTWPTRLDEIRVPNPRWKQGDPELDRHIYYAVPNNMDVPMVYFNRTLYDRVKEEREKAGQAMPPPPWLHWTWWDYALIAKALHRRSDTGRFLSFGGSQPDLEVLFRQIGASLRGDDRAAFDRLDGAERKRLGIDGLSWEECVEFWHRGADGAYTPFPNRIALAQALQFEYDLVTTIHGAPSASDSNQMANVGGFANANGLGQFKAGLLGMAFCGRWFLGQVRADCAFDWRLLRTPRWVPYEEWAGWQKRGLTAADRDGPWGEQEHALRGFCLPLGGRMAFISSSCTDPAKAFKFLEYLVTNQDFNKILLVEDGMGADIATARDYLAKPDPLFPEEVVNRPVEHELGTIANLYAKPSWPYSNHLLGHEQLLLDMAPFYSAEQILVDALQRSPERLDYAAFSRYVSDITPSSPGVGQALSEKWIGKVADNLALGRDLDARPVAQGPSALTLAVFTVLAAIFAGFAWLSRRERRAAALGAGHG